MMNKISTKLTKRLDGIKAYPVGISAEDIKKLHLTPDLISDILECIDSSEAIDQQMALFFLEVLVSPGALAESLEGKLISRVGELSRGRIDQVRPSCYRFLRRFGLKAPNYRDLMLEGLKDSDPIVRKEALLGYETYCQPKEVAPLEMFETDSYFVEISMNGPLLYELRNLALETIERVIGKTFKKSEKTEVIDGGEIAFWWDWAPYHRWRNSWLNKLIWRRPQP